MRVRAQWMGPGYRVGWATAAPALRQKLEFAQFAACLGPSSLAQACSAWHVAYCCAVVV